MAFVIDVDKSWQSARKDNERHNKKEERGSKMHKLDNMPDLNHVNLSHCMALFCLSQFHIFFSVTTPFTEIKLLSYLSEIHDNVWSASMEVLF